MKKALLVLVVVLLLGSLALAEANTPDFRNVTWGMSQEEVMNAETVGEPKEQDADALLYGDITIDSKECELLYSFKSDHLVGSAYFFKNEHTNLNDYIDDFQSIKSLLNKKYGESVSDDVIWKNDLFKDNYQSWGTAISMDHLVYRTEWQTERTKVLLILSGDNYEVHLFIGYYSKLEGEPAEDDDAEDLGQL